MTDDKKKVISADDISADDDDQELLPDERDYEDSVDEGPEDEPESEGDKSEAELYSKKVQKRINELTREQHEARRAREEAEAMREEAVRFARATANENAKLREALTQGDKVFRQTAGQGIDARIASARSEYKRAYEDGDTDGMLKANEEIAQLYARKERLAATPPPRPSGPPPQEQVRRILEEQPAIQKARKWAEKNPWFNTDPVMNAVAMGVLRKVQMAGGDPDSDTTYEAIDSEVRKRFPDYFANGASRQNASGAGSTVAPVARARRKTVQRSAPLTETQQSLIHELGITEEQYRANMAPREE